MNLELLSGMYIKYYYNSICIKTGYVLGFWFLLFSVVKHPCWEHISGGPVWMGHVREGELSWEVCSEAVLWAGPGRRVCHHYCIQYTWPAQLASEDLRFQVQTRTHIHFITFLAEDESLHKIKCYYDIVLLYVDKIQSNIPVLLQKILSFTLTCCTIYMIKSIGEFSQFANVNFFPSWTCFQTVSCLTLQNSWEGSCFSSGWKTCFVLIIWRFWTSDERMIHFKW